MSSGFDARMRDAFAVVTGEGRLDEQTLGGKARVRGRDARRQAGCPVTRSWAGTSVDAFERHLMNLEVEAAARDGALASVADVEQAARRLARRITA